MDELGYDVSPVERINRLFGGNLRLTEDDHFTYEWHGGYEKLTIQHDKGGSYAYEGSYHPGDGSCQGNPCWHCGRAFYEELTDGPWRE